MHGKILTDGQEKPRWPKSKIVILEKNERMIICISPCNKICRGVIMMLINDMSLTKYITQRKHNVFFAQYIFDLKMTKLMRTFGVVK